MAFFLAHPIFTLVSSAKLSGALFKEKEPSKRETPPKSEAGRAESRAEKWEKRQRAPLTSSELLDSDKPEATPA